MKSDIILAGVGGQGILSIAATIGMAALELGAGRLKKDDVIDPVAGIIFKIKIGDKVNKGQSIAEIHSNSKSKAELSANKIVDSITYSKLKVTKPKLIKRIIT